MPTINRRQLLKTALAAGAGGAAAAIAAQPAVAAFSPPAAGRQYQKYGGLNFTPIWTLKDGNRVDWTYNDNGSIYVTGSTTLFRTRLQLPQGAVIEEVQFNFFLGDYPGMDFNLIAFDGQNGYQPNIPFASANTPDPTSIQTISLPGLPVRVDNARWFYVLSWAPHAADNNHVLWGARVGYRPTQDSQ